MYGHFSSAFIISHCANLWLSKVELCRAKFCKRSTFSFSYFCISDYRAQKLIIGPVKSIALIFPHEMPNCPDIFSSVLFDLRRRKIFVFTFLELWSSASLMWLKNHRALGNGCQFWIPNDERKTQSIVLKPGWDKCWTFYIIPVIHCWLFKTRLICLNKKN